jgi:hypothetical protein
MRCVLQTAEYLDVQLIAGALLMNQSTMKADMDGGPPHHDSVT